MMVLAIFPMPLEKMFLLKATPQRYLTQTFDQRADALLSKLVIIVPCCERRSRCDVISSSPQLSFFLIIVFEHQIFNRCSMSKIFCMRPNVTKPYCLIVIDDVSDTICFYVCTAAYGSTSVGFVYSGICHITTMPLTKLSDLRLYRI